MEERLDGFSEMIRNAIPARSESTCYKVAVMWEDDLLPLEGLPGPYLSFVLNVLSDESLFRKRGSWNVLLALSREKHRFTPNVLAQVELTLLDNYDRYTDEDLCLAVCDFLARNFEEKSARRVLNNLKAIEMKKDVALHGFADDGLRTIDIDRANAK